MNIAEKKQDIFDKYNRFVSKTGPERLQSRGLDIALSGKEGVRVKDTEGNYYYDCFCSGGQQILGHLAPEIRDTFKEALKQYDLGNFILMSAQKSSLAKLLADITPGNLKHTVYGVGRGESNDFAMKLVRGATGRKEIICFEGASHGQTAFALTASDNPQQEALFGPLIPLIRRIPRETAALEQAVSNKTAAVIIEPLQSDAGVNLLPPGFLKKAREVCNRHGAALIFDEGQTAFGRTGLLFECRREGVVPDVLTVAKGMGGTYYPISATVFNSRLNRFMLTHPLVHLSTFGGADLGCIIAISTIELIRKYKLWEIAGKRGMQLIKGLKDIKSANAGKFKDVRGKGLLAGIEATDEGTAEKFTAALAAAGVIALPAPLNPAVIRFMPPADITPDEIDNILNAAGTAAKKI